MSRTASKTQAAATEAETTAEVTQEAAGTESGETTKTIGTRVYCGPSVRGVARQYTVYTGELPEALKTFVSEHPAAKALVVPTSRFAEVRKRLNIAGTAEAILYKKIKSEL